MSDLAARDPQPSAAIHSDHLMVFGCGEGGGGGAGEASRGAVIKVHHLPPLPPSPSSHPSRLTERTRTSAPHAPQWPRVPREWPRLKRAWDNRGRAHKCARRPWVCGLGLGRTGVAVRVCIRGEYSSIYTGCVSCLKPPLSTARWPHGQLAL